MKKYMLYFLYLVGLLVAGYVIFFVVFEINPLCIYFEKKGSLLSALGIIISAFIASLSVMISVDNTNKIEEEKHTKELHARLDMSFYMMDKNIENIRLLESYVRTNNPLFHKSSILNVLNLSLRNLEKLEDQVMISPTTIARVESYILGMQFIVEELPNERVIRLTNEFEELLKDFKDVTENEKNILEEKHT